MSFELPTTPDYERLARRFGWVVLLFGTVVLLAPLRAHVDDSDAQLYRTLVRHMLEDDSWLNLRYLKGAYPQFYEHLPFDPDGELISQAEWDAKIADWLPSDADRAYVASLMHAVHEPGKIANWIAAPRKGIHGNPIEFEYVRHH